MKKMRTWNEYLIEVLADQAEAIGHLEATLEDYQIFRNPAIVRDALRTVVEAQGGLPKLLSRLVWTRKSFQKHYPMTICL